MCEHAYAYACAVFGCVFLDTGSLTVSCGHLQLLGWQMACCICRCCAGPVPVRTQPGLRLRQDTRSAAKVLPGWHDLVQTHLTHGLSEPWAESVPALSPRLLSAGGYHYWPQPLTPWGSYGSAYIVESQRPAGLPRPSAGHTLVPELLLALRSRSVGLISPPPTQMA